MKDEFIVALEDQFMLDVVVSALKRVDRYLHHIQA